MDFIIGMILMIILIFVFIQFVTISITDNQYNPYQYNPNQYYPNQNNPNQYNPNQYFNIYNMPSPIVANAPLSVNNKLNLEEQSRDYKQFFYI